MASFSPSDVLYVTTEYRTLGELCDGRPWSVAEVEALVDAGRLPAATYVLPSGERRYPPDYFVLAENGDGGGDLAGLAARFFARHLTAGGTMTEADEDWQGFLSGQFGVCLHAVTPESMVAKTRLIARIEELVAAPAPADDGWCGALCAAVDELDALLRPFTDYDRDRWGDTSRDRLVGRVRARWPAVFATCGEGRGRSLKADAIA